MGLFCFIHRKKKRRREKDKRESERKCNRCCLSGAEFIETERCGCKLLQRSSIPVTSSHPDIPSRMSPCRPLIPPRLCSSPPPIPPRLPLYKGRTSNLFASISELLQKNVGWYWGPLKKEETELLLRGRPDGCFLMRDSSSLSHVFSLSVVVVKRDRRGGETRDDVSGDQQQQSRDRGGGGGSTETDEYGDNRRGRRRKSKRRIVDIRIEFMNNEFRLMANDFCRSYSSLVEMMDSSVQCVIRGDSCFVSQASRPTLSQMGVGVAPTPMKLHSHVSRHEVVAPLSYLSRMKLHQAKGDSSVAGSDGGVVAGVDDGAQLELQQQITHQADLLPVTLSNYVKSCPFYDPLLVQAVAENYQRQNQFSDEESSAV
ncbi:suppressor of cytokine signaling 7-like isoform X2 [Symsagittifera roscoffensis]|uniref:suppressor of cytokine signaling 7-like isoform X2 n=1 Tax=Symsagittifera roscoffensis TaxID=84072 RepID=UPI00307BC716